MNITLSHSPRLSGPLWRLPDPQSSVISLQQPVRAFMRESFQSLLGGSSARFLRTPLAFFAFIPAQHLQMNLGLLLHMKLKALAWQGQNSLGQNTLHASPFLQGLFQNLLSPGSLPAASPPSLPEWSPEALVQQSSANPEPEVAQRLQQINQERAAKGQASIDLGSVTREIEGIMNQAGLSEGEKKKRIAAIRKRLGLGKKDMKTLFTQRLKKLYEQAASILHSRLESTTDPLERQRLSAQLQACESKSALYKGMFRSAWSKLGGAFKKIGGFFKKAAAGLFKLASFAAPFLKFIPGLGTLASLAQNLFSKAAGFLTSKLSKVTKPFQALFQPYGDAAKVYLQKLIQAFKGGMHA